MKFLRIFILTLIFAFSFGLSRAATYSSQVIATSADENQGLVCAKFATTSYSALNVILGKNPYTHKAPAAPSEGEYKSEFTTPAYSSSGGNNACEVMVYLYAQPKEGYVFDHWVINNNQKTDYNETDANCNFTWSHYTQKSMGTNTTTAVAYFKQVSLVDTESNFSGLLVKLDKEVPEVGDEVTASFEIPRIAQTGTIGNKNMMARFSHWEDGEGNVLSYDEQYVFTVDKKMTLRAVFGELGEVPQPGKYYRVRNVYNRVLTVAGNYSWMPTQNEADVPVSLLAWALPDNHDYTEFWTGRDNNEWYGSDAINHFCVEAAPSTVFYVEDGKLGTSGNLLTGGVLSAQGVNTQTLTGFKLDVVNVDDAYFGYYGITASAAGLQAQIRPNGMGMVNVSTFKASTATCAMAIQPIDEDHVDDFWFGAYATENMYYDGGYWTSMYTAFPYKVYEPDGVEAYYVTATTEKNGNSYALMTKIEDGIVPAETAVLLKCKVPENTKANRLIPLKPSEVTATIEGNLLSSSYQLYSSDPTKTGFKDTRVKNDDNIRVFGINGTGEVGFFKLKQEEDNGQKPAYDLDVLKANKAYIDMNMLPAGVSALSFRLGTVDDMTGVESVVVGDNDGSGVVYDMMGRMVTNPVSGALYIVNGKKIIW